MNLLKDMLPAMSVASRLSALQGQLAEKELDALLVTELGDIRYLTGFTGSSALLLVDAQRSVFITDGRYDVQSRQQLAVAGAPTEIEIRNSLADQNAVLSAAIGAAGGRRIGLQGESITWSTALSYRDLFDPAEVVVTEGLVETLRIVKDPAEVARLAAAAQIADIALERCLGEVDRSSLPTEKEFALQLDFTMLRLGADGLSFETIVACGPNGALPHHRPGSSKLVSGELVVIDFGALVDGYHSDMTRTVCFGEPRKPRLVEMVDAVAEAQRRGVAAVGVGVSCREVDSACRDYLDSVGMGEAFSHSTGHGVGIDIHESPRVSSLSEHVFEAGNVITVEPGVYFEGLGGVRIEDCLLVDAQGITVFTKSPKTLVI